jgi:hypothetical protein
MVLVNSLFLLSSSTNKAATQVYTDVSLRKSCLTQREYDVPVVYRAMDGPGDLTKDAM